MSNLFERLLAEEKFREINEFLKTSKEFSLKDQEALYSFFIKVCFDAVPENFISPELKFSLIANFYAHEALNEKFIIDILFNETYELNMVSQDMKCNALKLTKMSLSLQERVFNDIYVVKKRSSHYFEENKFLNFSILNKICDYYLSSDEEPYFLAFHPKLNVELILKLIEAQLPPVTFPFVKISGESCEDVTLPHFFLELNNGTFIYEILLKNNVDIKTFHVLSKDSKMSLEELMFITENV